MAARRGVVVLAGLLALAAPARADVWTPARQVSDGPAMRPLVAVAPDGGGIVAWSRQAGFMGPNAGVGYTTRPDSVAPFGSPRNLGDEHSGPIAVAAGPAYGRLFSTASAGIVEAAGPLGGDLGTPQQVLDRADVLAVDANGDAVAVQGQPLQLAFRPAGGSFGAWQPLDGGTAAWPSAAIDADGDAAVAWTERVGSTSDWTVRVADCGAGGCTGGTQVSVQPAGGFTPSLAFDRRGDLAVAWVGPGYPSGDTVLVATRRRGAGFAAPRVVHEDGGAGVGAVKVEVDGAGDALAVWSNGFDSAGNAVVVWTSLSGSTRQTSAAERLPDGTWRGPQLVAQGNAAGDAFGGQVNFEQPEPRIAFDGAGRGLLAFGAEPEHSVYAADYDAAALVSPPRIETASVRLTRPSTVRVRFELSRAATVRATLSRGSKTIARARSRGRRGHNALVFARRKPLARGRYLVTVVAGARASRATTRIHLRVR